MQQKTENTKQFQSKKTSISDEIKGIVSFNKRYNKSSRLLSCASNRSGLSLPTTKNTYHLVLYTGDIVISIYYISGRYPDPSDGIYSLSGQRHSDTRNQWVTILGTSYSSIIKCKSIIAVPFCKDLPESITVFFLKDTLRFSRIDSQSQFSIVSKQLQ